MIEYFYEFKYGKALDDFDFDSRSESEPSNLYEAHAQVFSIADKYDIPGLKEIAIEQFRECFDASRSWAQDSADFLIATPFIYRHAPPNDRRLCREVLHCWQSGEWSTVAFSGREEFVQLLADVPDFAADLIGMASGVEAGSQLDEMDE